MGSSEGDVKIRTSLMFAIEIDRENLGADARGERIHRPGQACTILNVRHPAATL